MLVTRINLKNTNTIIIFHKSVRNSGRNVLSWPKNFGHHPLSKKWMIYWYVQISKNNIFEDNNRHPEENICLFCEWEFLALHYLRSCKINLRYIGKSPPTNPKAIGFIPLKKGQNLFFSHPVCHEKKITKRCLGLDVLVLYFSRGKIKHRPTSLSINQQPKVLSYLSTTLYRSVSISCPQVSSHPLPPRLAGVSAVIDQVLRITGHVATIWIDIIVVL